MRSVCFALLVGALVCVGCDVGAANLRDEEVQKILAAVPAKAPAVPKKARKVLLYGHCNGFTHGGAIEAAKVAFPAMGERTGAFEVVVSDDLAHFEADALAAFDAIILSNTTGDLLMPKKGNQSAEEFAAQKARGERLRENLMAWVKGGKGIMGIHGATDCSYSWKEYGEMIGGYFTGHPWNMKVAIKNDDPGHPLNAAFEGKGFEIKDEIYQFNRGVYSRDRQRVILSLDMAEGKTPEKGQRADKDYGISWVKTHGGGRVFYCALGHDQTIFMHPQVLAHLLAGLQFVLGDIEADTTPIALSK